MKLSFHRWLVESAPDEGDILPHLAELCRRKPRLPQPTTFLDSGQRAAVFNTTDPNVLIRVGPDDGSNEHYFLDEDIQESGGVVRVLAQLEMDVDGTQYVVTWKERVDENVHGWLLRNLPREQCDEILGVLCGLYHVDRDGLRTLMKHDCTKGLAEAILRGLPVSDLALEQNLGVTKDGRVVAFDL